MEIINILLKESDFLVDDKLRDELYAMPHFE